MSNLQLFFCLILFSYLFCLQFFIMALVHPEMYFNVNTKVTCLLWICNDQQLLVGTSDGVIQLWHCKSQKMLWKSQLFDEDKPILWLAKNEGTIFVQARFAINLKAIRMEDLENGDKIESIALHNVAMNFCHGDIYEELIAVPIGENQCEIIKIPNPTDKTVVIEPPSSSGFLGCIKISSEFIFLGYENGQLKMIEKSTWSPIFNLDLNHALLCMDLRNNSLILGTSEDCIYSVKIHTEEQKYLEIIKKRQIPNKGISSLKIRSDNQILICGSWDSTVRLFSFKKPENLKPLGALKFHQSSVDCVAVNNETQPYYIAAGSSDGYISIWNVYN